MSTTAAVVSVAAVVLLLLALAATLVIAWRRRRADRAARPAPGAAAAVGAGLGTSVAPWSEAAVVGASAAGSGPPAALSGQPAVGVASGAGPAGHAPEVPGFAAPGPRAAAWLLPAETWERTIRHADDRLARYPHRVAVAIAELDGVDIVADRYGRPAEERLAHAVEDTLRRSARATDLVARIGPRRFAVLLVETDAGGAERYAHRLRRATELWLEAVALPLRMRVAVADPPIGGTLTAALDIAESRLVDERAMLDHDHDSYEAPYATARRSPGGDR